MAGTTINRLSAVDSIEGGDQFPIYDNGNGDARKASASLVKEYVNSDLPSTYEAILSRVYGTPAVNDFTVAVSSGNTHLILAPSSGFALGTIQLPSSPSDKDRFLCNCTQQVSSLTIDGNGASVSGAPSALGADAFFELVYDASGNTWYRVG